MKQSPATPGLKPRLEAAFHLQAVLEGKPFAPIAPDRIADSRDRAFANRLVTTALRRHGHISFILGETLDKGVPQRAGPLEAILRLGITQLLHMEGIPAHSALHLAVESARAQRHAARYDRLVNGVLRNVQRRAETFAALPDAMLFPDHLRTLWEKAYGPDAIARFAQALRDGAPLDLTFKAPDPDLVAALGGLTVLGPTVRLAARDAAIADLPGYAEGAWWVQDAAAAIPARILAARPGENVLDLCAAPGGKTAQLAATGAQVTALDIAPDRMARVADNLGRLGLSAERVVADALAYRPGPVFDAIILDAPCSATGTFRRHPEVIWHRDQAGIAERVRVQRALLAHAASLLKPGGRLVYCVCSLEAAEGEDQIAWARDALADLRLTPIGPQALGGWSDPITPSGTLRLTPALELPGAIPGRLDGFFIALLTRPAAQ